MIGLKVHYHHIRSKHEVTITTTASHLPDYLGVGIRSPCHPVLYLRRTRPSRCDFLDQYLTEKQSCDLIVL